MAPDDILRVERVTKSFGALRAVNAVSCTVRRGEIFGIAGPNGSGKSTLFNLITSIPFPADSGRILFEGRPIERLRPHRIARAGVARTFQKDAEFRTLTVLENVLMGATYGHAGSGAAGQHAAAEAALAQVGLGPTMQAQPAGTLSVFDKKRLMLATALAMRPKLLLLDEPASGLTKPEIQDLIALVRAINRSGVTIVLIEHVLPLLLTVSERLMVLNQGEELVTGDPAEVVRDSRVVEAYLGRRAQVSHAA